MIENILYITGAGVSAESGIPTFRGNDGFWTIGSVNYTPQEMATRHMYQNNPEEFLLWYFKRFASYRNVMPNKVHHFYQIKDLSHKTLTAWTVRQETKTIFRFTADLIKLFVYDEMDNLLKLTDAPWDEIDELTDGENNDIKIKLLDAFKISKETKNRSWGSLCVLLYCYLMSIIQINIECLKPSLG